MTLTLLSYCILMYSQSEFLTTMEVCQMTEKEAKYFFLRLYLFQLIFLFIDVLYDFFLIFLFMSLFPNGLKPKRISEYVIFVIMLSVIFVIMLSVTFETVKSHREKKQKSMMIFGTLFHFQIFEIFGILGIDFRF